MTRTQSPEMISCRYVGRLGIGVQCPNPAVYEGVSKDHECPKQCTYCLECADHFRRVWLRMGPGSVVCSCPVKARWIALRSITREESDDV